MLRGQQYQYTVHSTTHKEPKVLRFSIFWYISCIRHIYALSLMKLLLYQRIKEPKCCNFQHILKVLLFNKLTLTKKNLKNLKLFNSLVQSLLKQTWLQGKLFQQVQNWLKWLARYFKYLISFTNQKNYYYNPRRPKC